jgi:hypothetical protein
MGDCRTKLWYNTQLEIRTEEDEVDLINRTKGKSIKN